jgi:hypothetical protein
MHCSAFAAIPFQLSEKVVRREGGRKEERERKGTKGEGKEEHLFRRSG